LNKYFDSAIALTSICVIGLATLSLAEGTIAIADEQPDTVQAIQLQGLDNSLAANLQSLNNISPIASIKPASQPISVVAVNIIKEFEGFETHAYIDTDGTPVIGYGLSKIEGKSVQIGDQISTQEANSALNRQLKTIQQELDQAITVNLSDHQLGALASLSFNVGVNFVENSTLIRKINAGDHHGAADEFLRWDKANVEGRLVQLPGLTRRRQAERQLFLQGITPVENS
jgi:lysozyme